MSGTYSKEMHEHFRKEQDAKAARVEEDHRERTERESLLRAWLADGGSEADFRREWPRLRDEERRQRVLDADKHAREQMRAHGPSRIPTASL